MKLKVQDLVVLFGITLVSWYLFQSIIVDRLHFHMRSLFFLWENQLVLLSLLVLMIASLFFLYYQLAHKVTIPLLNKIIFSLYLVSLYIFLMVRPFMFSYIQLNPLSFIDTIRFRDGWVQLIGNLLLFVPFGIVFAKKKFLFGFGLVLFLKLLVEFYQLHNNRGFFDLGDVSLVLIGYTLAYLASNKVRRHYIEKVA